MTKLQRLFDDWELQTRGVRQSPSRVPVEPRFTPLFANKRAPKPVLDDGRRPSLFDRAREVLRAPVAADDVAEEPDAARIDGG